MNFFFKIKENFFYFSDRLSGDNGEDVFVATRSC